MILTFYNRALLAEFFNSNEDFLNKYLMVPDNLNAHNEKTTVVFYVPVTYLLNK
jgi:hypothetical protein